MIDKRMLKLFIRPKNLLYISCIFFSPVAMATEWNISGGVVTTFQATNDDRIRDEFQASADLEVTRSSGKGEWQAHFEANTSAKANGVSAILPESNGDAGSALDEDDGGRVQLSELRYRHAFNERISLTAGMLDVSGFFDQSRIASDETTQFLGASFTGNPAIEFPDYTLGLVYEHGLDRGLHLRFAITSSNGLADNPQRSYAQLTDFDANEKGVFAIGSATWEKAHWQFRSGLWTHTADHERLNDNSLNGRNYGAYILTGYKAGPHAMVLRLGAANAEVSRAAGFTGLGYQYQQGQFTLGAGAARIIHSSYDPVPDSGDTTQLEFYARYALTEGVFMTANAQFIRNSNFDASNTLHDTDIEVYGLRVTWLFD